MMMMMMIIIWLKLDKVHCYAHKPKPREKSHESKVTKLNNQPWKWITTIRPSKPGVIIHGKDTERCLLIDISIAGDTNLKKKDAKQILKI